MPCFAADLIESQSDVMCTGCTCCVRTAHCSEKDTLNKTIKSKMKNKCSTSKAIFSRRLMRIFEGSMLPYIVLFLLLCDYIDAQGQSCSLHTCKPPSCRCPTHSIPGNLRPNQVPQMILIAFDDAVNWDNWDYYRRLFPPDGRRKNPNGCPITGSLFVSHNYTDYCMVRKLHARGMEIGDHSVTHKLPRRWWTDADRTAIADEVLTQKQNLVEKAHIPVGDIRGWRSPFLQPAGDDLFSVLRDNNFTYDATMTYSFPKNLYSPVLWPFTLDYGYTLVCNIARCPVRPYPGLWIVPVVVLMDYREQKPCAYVDDCANMPRDKTDAYQMLWKNFLRNYRSNRAPLYLNLHSPWLNTPYHLEALDEFIQKMVDMEDVYLVTVQQALQWQMNPTPLDKLRDFQPWQCPNFEPNGEDRKICSFTYKHRTSALEHGGLGPPPGLTTRDPRNIRHKWIPRKDSKGNSLPSNKQGTGSREPIHVHEAESNKDHENENIVDMRENSNVDDDHHHHSVEKHRHDGSIDESNIDSNSFHHHHHRAHRPWFLKNHAEQPIAGSLASLFSLLTIIYMSIYSDFL